MQVDRDVTIYLSKTKASAPADLKPHFAAFEDLYDRKLWHQLTVALTAFAALPSAAVYLVPLYDEFVSEWEKRMNQLALVQYAAKASRTIKDPKAALAFLEKHAARLRDNKDAKDAYVLATMEAAHMRLVTGDFVGCKAAIDESEATLNSLPHSDTVINAAFYRVAADYYKAKAAYPLFYHNALLFLSSVSLDDLSAAEKHERAYDLALSALLGDGLYNFGELLMHPVLDSLTNSPSAWLRSLLFAFNSGDNDAFEKISKSADFLKMPLLVSSLPFLSQKLCLMALMETVFRRTKEDRGRLPFAAVAKDTRVAVHEVEHLVMKALSLGLIKGSIDEIDQTVSVTWVQPRVLEMGQIKVIRDRLAGWSGTVKEKVLSLEQEGGVDISAAAE
ncbi:PCI-domain-containing protein [Rhizoclosmatium globosum]|uniref:PCI-domain-containing protein n=1 Tax=Rhizoclosmatium globosum TaxID=329046 RepID=A0A1Y2CM28_9FUNG|nr:PCI-domain-containing protein [Rhizoclosmatium globosum]|eukprot:ORY48062.1 PCI-domain-containing protein [Rhizoclosmatium globosum]